MKAAITSSVLGLIFLTSCGGGNKPDTLEDPDLGDALLSLPEGGNVDAGLSLPEGGNGLESVSTENFNPSSITSSDTITDAPALPPRGATIVDLPSGVNSNLPPLTSSEFFLDPGLVEFNTTPRVVVSEFPLGTVATKLEVSNIATSSNVHEYSRRQAWNADESLILIGNVITNADTLEQIQQQTPLSSAWNWSNIHPNIVYGIRYSDGEFNQFGYYNTDNEIFTQLHLFSESTCSIGSGEGRLSNDDSKILIYCKKDVESTLYAYDLINGLVSAQMSIDPESGYDWATYSPSGEYILIYYDKQQTRSVYRHRPDFSEPVLLGNRLEHGDIGTDSYGDELLVMIGDDSIFAIRLRDGKTIETARNAFPNDLGFGHVSCLSIQRPGWCYFSADRAGYVGAIQLSYSSQPNSQSELEFTGNYEHWGWHRSSLSSYERIPKASVSPSGRQIIYTTDLYGQTNATDVIVTSAQGTATWPTLLQQ